MEAQSSESDVSALQEDIRKQTRQSEMLDLQKEKDNIQNLFPHFTNEQLDRSAIGIVTNETYFRTVKAVLKLPPGTVLLVRRKDKSGERYIGVLPDKRSGFVNKGDVTLLYTINFLKALSYYNRAGWDFYLEPAVFMANNPVRFGAGGRIAWAPWPNGFNGQKIYHLELSAHYLQSVIVSGQSARPFSLGLSSEVYVRLGLGGRFMLGPSLGWNRYQSSDASSNQIAGGLNGRYMITRDYGLFGQVSRVGFSNGSFRALLGLSFGF